MGGTLVGLAVALFGIDAGWQPLPEGGSEYIIQIEPHMLERLREGEAIQSDILPEARGVRSFRVIVGTDELPREKIPVPSKHEKPVTTPPELSTSSPSDLFPIPAPTSPDLPRAFPSTTPSRPLSAEPAVFEQETNVSEKQSGKEVSSEQSKPWLLFWAVAGTAFGFFAAFIYLLWIHWETRNRYRALLAQCPPGGWSRPEQS